jgi:hypothetical protein
MAAMRRVSLALGVMTVSNETLELGVEVGHGRIYPPYLNYCA